MLPIELLIKKYKRMNGQGRYMNSLCEGMTQIGVEFKSYQPTYPLLIKSAQKPLKRAGFDLAEFFSTFPVAAPLSKNSVKHLMSQQMGTLLMFNPSLKNTAITVYDIIPYLVRHNKEQNGYRHPIERLFDKLSLIGLRKADVIITISEFTKQTLIETLSLPAEQIDVVLSGMDHDVFRQVPISDSFRTRHHLPAEYRYLLYVGSELPRKNLFRLVEAFAELKAKMPNVKLIKIGTPLYGPGYQQLQQLIDNFALEDDILFYDHLSEEDLIRFYNAADLFVFPSLYEGFGMPPLEAMACGTPVVCSNATSLPEVVGDAAILIDPYDTEAMTEAMYEVLSDDSLQEELRHKGLERASQFTWERAAKETVAVYEKRFNTV